MERFELELLGGPSELAYRTQRPEVLEMPWGTLDVSQYSPELLLAARTAWTGAAFQEFRTGTACAATLQALFVCRAPLDLIAIATRFPLDELVHVELCSRLAMELGGAVPLDYEPNDLLGSPPDEPDPLMRALHMVVAYFCVGEAASIPLLHGTAQAATHALPRAVLRRIVRDEADHGTFGFTVLDWALPMLEPVDLEALATTADRAIRGMKAGWQEVRARKAVDETHITDLGWMGTEDYLTLAERSLERQVLIPLRARGLPIQETALGIARAGVMNDK